MLHCRVLTDIILVVVLVLRRKLNTLSNTDCILLQYTEYGIYLLRLCKDGCWSVIQVDDYLPCSKDRTLVFSKVVCPLYHVVWLTVY